jgi:dUTP pyrophosphatase
MDTPFLPSPALLETSGNLPPPAIAGDVGYNLPASADTFIQAHGFASVPTGIHVEIPPGHFGLVLPRSSANKSGALLVLTGVIDNGYRGELLLLVHNLSEDDILVKKGIAIGQLVLLPAVVFPIQHVATLSPSDRGHNGFGSTANSI